jgi:calcineurin-like phosphoesterase family protein/2'-5' RNA ligase
MNPYPVEIRNPYLIEIRLVGSIKRDIINLVKSVGHKFKTNMRKTVPHITLVGPFRTHDETRLVKDFINVCKKTQMIHYRVEGVDLFSKLNVVYLNVAHNDELYKFRSNLCDVIKGYSKLNRWDFRSNFKFHTTIAAKVESNLIEDIIRYINSCKPLIHDVPLLRATLLKRGKILCEFDFVTGKPLAKWEQNHFIQSRDSIIQYYNDIKESKTRKPKVFFTSDFHLGDKYIIDKCFRPFSSISAMNLSLTKNWNSEILPQDTVYYLGDFSYKYTTQEEVDNWISKLNGNIIFITGNDQIIPSRVRVLPENEICVNGIKLFMVHSPHNIPDDVTNDSTYWSIHGHVQNHNVKTYPFINRENHTVNVSVDVTNYRPVSLDEIIEAISTVPKTEESEFMLSPNKTRSLFAHDLDI